MEEMTYWELQKISIGIRLEMLSRHWVLLLVALVIVGIVIYFRDWR